MCAIVSHSFTDNSYRNSHAKGFARWQCDNSSDNSFFGSSCFYNFQCGSNVCVPSLGESLTGEFCVGSPSCSMFSLIDDCNSHSSHGCSWDTVGDAVVDAGSCNLPRTWSCGAEICSNGIDDDSDGLVDCQDDDCRVTGAMTLSASEVSSYACAGSSQVGDVGVGNYYCGVAESDADVSFCCESGYRPVQDLFSSWFCDNTNPCYPNPLYPCGSTYSGDFASWLSDSSCVNPGVGSACCSVVQFGETAYYSDTGNVKVY